MNNNILGKPKTLENFLMKTAEAMEKMRRIEGRVSTDQVNRINVPIQSIVGNMNLDKYLYHFENDHNIKKHFFIGFEIIRCTTIPYA